MTDQEKTREELYKEIELLKRKLDSAAQWSQLMTRSLINAPIDMVALINLEGRFLVVNDAAARMLDQSEEKLVGRNLFDYFPDDFSGSRKNHLNTAIESRKPVRFQEVWQTRYLDNQFYPVFNLDGEVFQLVFYSRDKTEIIRRQKEQAKLETHLRRVQKLETLGSLAGGIAHDFNNILSPIIGYADLSLRALEPDTRVYEFQQKILAATKRARELIQHILLFNRSTEDEKHPVQIHLVTKEVVKLLRATIPANIQIQHFIDNNTGLILADSLQVHQVLMNLCMNGIKSMGEENGVLDIRLEKFVADDAFYRQFPGQTCREYAMLTVRDTGCGIPLEIIPRIFESFFTTRKYGEGAGLGLSVAHGIIREHRGEIGVSSIPNEGTTFRVYLPRSECEQDEIESGAGPLPKGSERVLFVDDNAPVGDIAGDFLRAQGYTTTVILDGREALSRFREDPSAFDIVITGLSMPHISGVQLAQGIKTIRPDIPVILTTGYSNRINAENVTDFGIDMMVMKPLEPREVAVAIRNLLDR